jgi:lipopolysaccharide transport system ATP-binding protein
MNKVTIRVENMSKHYRLGQREPYKALREVLPGLMRAPARLFRERLPGTGSGNAAEDGSGRERLWALRDVSFEVQEGEVVGIIGRNGAGKSTLLKILSRITLPAQGCATLYGRVGSLLEVGTGFHPELTGRENIYLNGAILGMKRAEIEQKFAEIVDFAEVEKFLDTPVKRYSSGMYVRLAFAVAAHLEPEILIVDEVLAVGDAAFQRKCMGKMDDVAQQGRTILFVSHNMNAIQRLCTRALLFEQGRLVQDGPTGEVVSLYMAEGTGEAGPGSWLDTGEASRKGSGQARVTGIRYSSASEAARSQPYSDGPLEVSFQIISDAERPVGSLAVILYDRLGTKLVNADTISLGETIHLREGLNQVDLRIERLHLNPGSYILGWWLADPLGRTFDFVENGFVIEVSGLTSSGLGIRPKNDGTVTCDFQILKVS